VRRKRTSVKPGKEPVLKYALAGGEDDSVNGGKELNGWVCLRGGMAHDTTSTGLLKRRYRAQQSKKWSTRDNECHGSGAQVGMLSFDLKRCCPGQMSKRGGGGGGGGGGGVRRK